MPQDLEQTRIQNPKLDGGSRNRNRRRSGEESYRASIDDSPELTFANSGLDLCISGPLSASLYLRIFHREICELNFRCQ